MPTYSKKQLLDFITAAAEEFNIDLEFMFTMANIESGFNHLAKNPSGASGLYQFMLGTAKAYGLKDRFDPKESARAAAKYARDNTRYLKSHGYPVTGDYLYLAHQQGMGGAVIVLNAAKNGLELPVAIRRNIDANGGKGKTPQQFVTHWREKYVRKVEETKKLVATF